MFNTCYIKIDIKSTKLWEPDSKWDLEPKSFQLPGSHFSIVSFLFISGLFCVTNRIQQKQWTVTSEARSWNTAWPYLCPFLWITRSGRGQLPCCEQVQWWGTEASSQESCEQGTLEWVSTLVQLLATTAPTSIFTQPHKPPEPEPPSGATPGCLILRNHARLLSC